MTDSFIHHPSSYRDPAGFIFSKNGVLYRQVNKVFSKDFDFFLRVAATKSLLIKGCLSRMKLLMKT